LLQEGRQIDRVVSSELSLSSWVVQPPRQPAARQPATYIIVAPRSVVYCPQPPPTGQSLARRLDQQIASQRRGRGGLEERFITALTNISFIIGYYLLSYQPRCCCCCL